MTAIDRTFKARPRMSQMCHNRTFQRVIDAQFVVLQLLLLDLQTLILPGAASSNHSGFFSALIVRNANDRATAPTTE